MAAGILTTSEEAQLAQTIEMFEVITQSQPYDYQSLEILKEAYSKLIRETDVINTYLVYLRFELMRGNLDESGWKRETELVRKTLRETNKPHLHAFLDAWK